MPSQEASLGHAPTLEHEKLRSATDSGVYAAFDEYRDSRFENASGQRGRIDRTTEGEES